MKSDVWITRASSFCRTLTYTFLFSRPLQSLRISTFIVFGVCFFVSIATFNNYAGFKYTQPIGLFITYLLFPAICTVVYAVSQLILVVRTLDDRWVIGNIVSTMELIPGSPALEEKIDHLNPDVNLVSLPCGTSHLTIFHSPIILIDHLESPSHHTAIRCRLLRYRCRPSPRLFSQDLYCRLTLRRWSLLLHLMHVVQRHDGLQVLGL